MSKAKVLQFLFFVGLILMITNCEKSINIDVGQIHPRLVVNSILDKDSILKIQLSQSKSMMDSTQSIAKINSATIKIFEDEVLKQTLTTGKSGLYTANFKPKLGSGYMISVDDTGLGHVEASTFIPSPPDLFTATQTTELTPGSAPQYIKFNVSIKNQSVSPDYFYLRAFIIKKGYFPGANSNFVTQCNIYSDDNIVVTDDHTLKGVLFDDVAFLGQSYDLIVYTPTKVSTSFYLWFELSSLSPDYYRYLYSAVMQNNAGSNPFAEPVTIKTNVLNGAGIFGAENSIFVKAVTF